jgi:hypothetical protein
LKYTYEIREISKQDALWMVEQFHYSNSLPRLNRHYLGFYLDNMIVGLVTLGWGTRPLHTIARLFPSLVSQDYYEIGRMCMTEAMPRNSESQMLSQLVKWVKRNLPEIKLLFTWADGMLGKVGYVYQASNFIYAGFSDAEFYMRNGQKLHPRQTKAIFGLENDTRMSVRPTLQQLNEYNIRHIRGKQFRYIYFTCDKKLQQKLRQECTVPLSIDHPKEHDLAWRVKNENGKWKASTLPEYKTDRIKDFLGAASKQETDFGFLQ